MPIGFVSLGWIVTDYQISPIVIDDPIECELEDREEIIAEVDV